MINQVFPVCRPACTSYFVRMSATLLTVNCSNHQFLIATLALQQLLICRISPQRLGSPLPGLHWRVDHHDMPMSAGIRIIMLSAAPFTARGGSNVALLRCSWTHILTSFDWNWNQPSLCQCEQQKMWWKEGSKQIFGGIAILSMLF